MNQQFTRRSFLRGTIVAGAALSLPARLYASVDGANSDIRIGVIGFNGRGQDHISGLLKCKGVRLTALCDVDQRVLDKGKAQLEKKGQQVQTYTDLRKMLESKEIDAITTATPNHWHALASIWAIEAGKDVYVEKPVSHNVWEGSRIVAAARKHGKICQTGTQSRSAIGLQQAREWAMAGNLGKILWVRGTCYKRRASIGKVDGEQPWPENVDKDLWFGPAPIKPLTRKQLHYDWHWVWDTGNGDLGNQGIHQMDIARWFLGEQALSPSILSVGGRVGYIDDGETPNTMFVMHNYAKAPLIFEVRGLPAKPGEETVAADGSQKKPAEKMDSYRGSTVGVVVQFEGGHLVIPSYTKVEAFDKNGASVKKWESKEGESHYENFLKAVRSRKSSDLNADILEGHLSSALCHTGNISYRLGKKNDPEAIREKIKGDKEAADSYDRMVEHLGTNGVDLKKEQLSLGEALKMDPKTEKFIGNAEASKLLTREYRKPFEVV
jgi:predicted dehydrogenase